MICLHPEHSLLDQEYNKIYKILTFMNMLLEHPIEWLALAELSIIDYNIEITRIVANIPNHILESECGQQVLAYIEEETNKVECKKNVAEWLQGRELLNFLCP